MVEGGGAGGEAAGGGGGAGTGGEGSCAAGVEESPLAVVALSAEVDAGA